MRAIILPPTIEAIDLAATLLTRFSEEERESVDFFLTGSRRIRYVLTEEFDKKRYHETYVLQGEVEDPEALRPCLTGMRRVTWFYLASNARLQQTFADFPNITGYRGETLQAAFDVFWRLSNDMRPPLLPTLEADAAAGDASAAQRLEDLTAWVEYKKALSFMELMSAKPIGEAVLHLANAGMSNFAVEQLSPADRASIELYRQLNLPFLEGFSEPARQLKSRIVRVARTDLNVLLIGETGTGKEAAAFFLHEFSDRRGQPYRVLNCAGLNLNLLHAELFGHAKGAFTDAKLSRKGLVEEAEGGTLFLDEVAHTPPEIQTALLRFLQTKTFQRLGDNKVRKADVRIIAAARPEIYSMITDGRYRDDLFYRLAEFELTLPSLRDMPEDLFYFVRNLIYRSAPRVRASQELVEATLEYFQGSLGQLREQLHLLHGNVRELQRIIQRRMLFEEDVIAELAKRPQVEPPAARQQLQGQPFEELPTLDDLKTQFILEVVERYKGEVPQADIARKLGISVNTLKTYLRREDGGLEH